MPFTLGLAALTLRVPGQAIAAPAQRQTVRAAKKQANRLPGARGSLAVTLTEDATARIGDNTTVLLLRFREPARISPGAAV